MQSAVLAVVLAIGAPPPTGAADESLLRAVGIATDGPGLIEFFRRRTPPAPAEREVAALIEKLSDPAQAVRDRAMGELIGYGPYSIDALRQAANTADDADRAARALQCLQQLEGVAASDLVVHASRLLAARKPAGAADALLRYRPFADDPAVASEVESALAAVAMREGKIDAALTAALTDAVPARRAAAAAVLGRLGLAYLPTVRPLLRDPKPTVRLRAALALAGSHDAAAIPVLIDLLAELPPEGRQRAEEFLKELAGEWAVAGPAGHDATARRLRRDAWAAWWRGVDGAALLQEFRARTLSDSERERVEGLIGRFADGDAAVRERAADDIVAIGTRAAPLLRRATASGDARVATLAEGTLRRIEREMPTPLPAAASRLLALRRPPETLSTLLAYLPCAESEAVAQQVVDLLVDLGVREGQAEPALANALADKSPARRGAAAVAICRGNASAHLPAVRGLLRDADGEVRRQAALALASVGEKDAVPVLVQLLADAPIERAWEIEDFLSRVAGEQVPRVSLPTDAAGRAQCRDAWLAWWREHGDKVDPARAALAPRALGYLLIVESYDPARRNGSVAEFDSAGKQRWKIDGLQYPQYAEAVSGDRVLIAEQNLNRVTERDHAGKIVWEKSVPMPFMAQRLRNGNTFIAARQQLLEFDRDGKQVFQHHRPGDTILAARKLRDGHVAFVTYQGNYARLDPTGKELKSFRVPINQNFGTTGGDVLPDDRVLISTGQLGKVNEYDATGKSVWEASVPFAGVPHRLPNGHTLVPSHTNTRVTEIDRTGKLIAERKDLPIRPWFASKR